MPHNLVQIVPTDVDYKIIRSFLQFYTTYLEFVNCHLFNTLNIKYPPKISGGILQHKCEKISNQDLHKNLLNSLNYPLKVEQKVQNKTEIDIFPEFNIEDDCHLLPKLFQNMKFFISREVPKKPFVFAIRSCGGTVSWEDDSNYGILYTENDLSITHQIIDRPSPIQNYIGRVYIQPQWIFDSINNKKCLPIDQYVPSASLPPHLSPFNPEKYPHLLPKINPETQMMESSNKEKLAEKNIETEEQKKLASLAISKNKKKLYDKLQKIRKSRVKTFNKIQEKRKKLAISAKSQKSVQAEI